MDATATARQGGGVAQLVTIVGPLASGKGTVAHAVADRLAAQGRTSVVADVDDVAAMVAGRGAGASGLWPAAHAAHGALVAGWLATEVGVVIAVGNVYDADERRALAASLPPATPVLRVVLDAPLAVTWARAVDDPARGLSRERGFHERAHARFRTLLPTIPADLVLDTATLSPERCADAVLTRLTRLTTLTGPVERGQAAAEEPR